MAPVLPMLMAMNRSVIQHGHLPQGLPPHSLFGIRSVHRLQLGGVRSVQGL